MKLAYLSDIHLNFVPKFAIEKLGQELVDTGSDCAIIAGDIAEGSSIQMCLRTLISVYKKPIYYICGNHDYYKSTFSAVKQEMIELTNQKDSLLKYLPSMGVVELTPSTCLIGHDSWYDCRFGDYWNSHFELSDFDLIEDIKYLKSKLDRYSLFTKLGDDCADYIQETFPKAAEKYKNIIYCQHVPPFEEASLYMGKRSSHLSMPFFSCKASGVALSEMGRAYPKVKIACLTAHTHDKAFFKKDNINVYVAGAQYYYPTVYATLELK